MFASAATNLVAGGDATKDVYRKDLQTGAVTLVSVNTAGQKANAAVFGDPDVSYDGRAVSFGSGAATNLFPGDGNNASDIVVRDIAAGTTILAAQSAAGAQANGTTERSAISADGHVVAFEAPTGTNNLLPGDATPTDFNDVVVRNLAAGTTAGASDPTAATGSGFPDISGDGRYVVFETGFAYDATNDVGGNDVYRRDMTTPPTAMRPRVGRERQRDGLGRRRGAARDLGRRRPRRVHLARHRPRRCRRQRRQRRLRPRPGVAAHPPGERSGGRDHRQQHRLRAAARSPATAALVAFVHSDVGARSRSSSPATSTTSPTSSRRSSRRPTRRRPRWRSRGRRGGPPTPSGIGEVTINGAAVAVGADGTFAVPAALGSVLVQAVDGAGNATSLTRPALPVTTQPTRPRVQRLKASLKGRKVTVRFLLSADARVTVTLLRRTVRKKPRRRVVLTRVRRPLTKALKAGQRSVVLTLGRRPAPGRYTVRVRANASGLVSTATTALVVKPLTPKRR